MLFFALLAPSLNSAVLYYYTYSCYENGSNGAFREAFAHLYSIRDATDCWLYRATASNSGVDISTGAVYTSLGMLDGQPFDPVAVDAPGPGFGDSFFMLKSNYPMIWEMGAWILGNGQCGATKQSTDRDTFIISDNASFRGTRFFTHLDWDQGCSTPAVAGDIMIMYNPNPTIATVTVSRWTGVAGNYTPLVSQTIDPDSAWETGGTMPWEVAGAEGTDVGQSTHYRITSDIDIEVSRGNYLDSDADNAWTCVPAWETGLKVGKLFYGICGTLGPSPQIVVTDASGAGNTFQIYYYVPSFGAQTANYIIGTTSAGNWVATGGVNAVGANATVSVLTGGLAPAPAGGIQLYKVVAANPVQVQMGYRITNGNTASNEDWFTGITGNNGPLNSLFRFKSGNGDWITAVCPQVGTSVTVQQGGGILGLSGIGSNLAGGPLLAIGPVNSDTRITTVPNEALTWRTNGAVVAGQFTVTSTKPVYTFSGQIGGEKYYSAPVPQVIFSQLKMVKSVSAAIANPNDFLTYTMSYSNTGTGTLSFVDIWDTIPVNSSYVPGSASSAPPASSTTFNGVRVDWNYNTIMPGASGTVSFVVQIDAAAPLGSFISNTMSAQDDQTFMPAPGKSNIVKTLVAPPLVAVSKYNNPPGTISVSTPISYTLSYSNTGTSNATNVWICDTVPAGTLLVGGSPTSAPFFPPIISGNLICWNIGTLQSQFTATAVTISPNVVYTSTSMTVGTEVNVYTCGDGLAAKNLANNTNGYEVVGFPATVFPGGAVITSVVIEARWWSATLYHHSLGLAFTTNGSNTMAPSVVNAASANATPGSLDSWDITSQRAWTPALVNALRLQASLLYQGGGADFGFIECLRVIVNYTLPSGNVFSGTLAFQVQPQICAVNVSNTAQEADAQSNGSFSNPVYNTIMGCTPSPTPTRTPSYTSSPTPSPTPSRTPTPTPTLTASPTSTSTWTPTASPTSSPTPTPSATPTHSPTRTPTPTFTPTMTRTWTQTHTPTSSQTVTPTWTPTATTTITFTASTSPTPTPTQTSTRSWTQTRTPTMSQTATPTWTPTATTTITFTASTSPTPTPTQTSTRSWTQTNTPTSSRTVTLTVTPTATPTVTFTATPTETPTFTDSPIASDTVSPTDSPSPTVTPTETPSITLTATPTITLTATPTFSETPSMTLTPINSDTNTPTWTLTSSPTPTASPSNSPSPSPSDSPSPSPTPSVTVTLTAVASPTHSPTITASPSATQSPVPLPFQITVKVFNSAGEEVALLYSGGVTAMPGAPTLNSSVVQSGSQGVSFVGLEFLGKLKNGVQTLTWSGLNSNGGVVSGGIYYIHVESTDPFGSVSAYNLPVTVLQAKPSNEINIFNSAGELVYHESFDSAAVPLTDLSLDQSAFAPTAGKLGGQLHDAKGVMSSWSWDGKGADGHLLSPGIYTIQLSSSVSGQSVKPVLRQVQILAAPDSSDASPHVFSQQPLGSAALPGGLVISYVPSAVISVQARLYNMAGELVATAADASPGGQLRLEAGRLSSGIYLVEFTYRTPAGSNKRSIIKAAIVR